MKNSKILNILNEIEKRFSVDTWQIKNIYVWPLIRIDIMFQLIIDDGYRGAGRNCKSWQKNRVVKISRKLVNWLRVVVGDYKKNEYNFKDDTILFSTHMADRNIRLQNGVYYDHNMDGLKVYFDKKYCLKTGGFEFMGELNPVKRFTNSFMTLPLELFAALAARFWRTEEEVLPQYDEVLEFLKSEGIKINLTRKDLDHSVRTIIILSRLIEKRLLSSNTKLAFCMCYYSAFQFAFILACKKAQIPVIDLQHGIAGGTLHPAYAGWSNIPKEGYQLLPNYFWCWSKSDFNAINNWAQNVNCHKAILGGNLEIANWLDNDNELTAYYDKIIEKTIGDEDKKIVLVSLQTGILIPEWVLHTIRRSTDTLRWLVRFHPGQHKIERDAIKIQFGAGANIEFQLANTMPLYALLRTIDVHITDFSTVIVDAIPFGIKSISYGKDKQSVTEMFCSEIREGNLRFAHNGEELLDLIIKSKKHRVKTFEKTVDPKLVIDQLVKKYCNELIK